MRSRRGIGKEFQRFYESVGIPLLLVHSSDGVILYANAATEALTGYPQASLNGQALSMLFAPEHRRRLHSMVSVLNESRAKAEINETDLLLRKKSGRKVVVNTSSKSLIINRQKVIAVCVMDVSELKQFERERQRAIAEMTQISKLADIGRLAAGVAHELNNPLMIIAGFAENIDLLLNQPQVEARELKLQVMPILRASERMGRIIQQMTRIARSDDLKLVHIDLAEILEDVLVFMQNQLKYSDVKVSRSFADNRLIKGDPNRIEQVIINIISNACHALTQIKGERKITLKIEKQGARTVLTIWNNGPIIPDEIKSRLMTPFFTTKEVGEGTGLGLSVSHGIMKAHGGNLKFFSSKKAGTGFSLVFPAQDDVALSQATELCRKVLVVDHEAFARRVLTHKLQRFGYQVLEAPSAEVALEKLTLNQDIISVFTDVSLPGMGGHEFIKRLRERSRELMVFAMAGDASEKIAELEVRRLGVDGLLAKPLDREEFSQAIQTIEANLQGKKREAA